MPTDEPEELSDTEAMTEREVEREAAVSKPDPITSREALEEELIDEGRSDLGEDVGEHIE